MEDNIDREKSLFLTQIKFLDEELERCQLECDALEARNKDLPALCSALQDDRTDISEYLKLLVVEKEAEAEEVKKRLENQLQVEEADREAVRLQHGRQMEELQQRLDELQCDSRRTAAASSETVCEEQQEQQELEELEELEEQLRQQQADLDSVRQQLLSVRKATAASLGSNNDKPWSSWKLRVPRAVKASSDKLIWNIVQEEREEHGELRGPFQLLLEENEELWGKKKELQDQERVHHSDMERERRRLQEATNKKLSYRKEEEQLTRQCQQLQKELRRCSTASESLQEEEEALRALLASASELCHQRSLDLAALRAELHQESSRRRRLEGVTQEGVSALRLLLTEREDSRRPSAARWRRLLGVLEAPVPQRPDSAPGQKPEPEPDARRAEAPSFATDPLFLMARYRPGDLGLVPRPSWTQGASACRTGAQQNPAGPISDSLWSPAPFPASTQWSPAPPPASTQISPAPPPASTQRSPATAGGETSVSNLKASAAAHVRPHSY